MASGGHRNMIQGEQYQNQDVHLTVACLRARRSQLSPRDAFYQQIQPERYQLKPQDRKTHGILRKGESSLYSNTYNNVRCRINEEKAELKTRLQQVQRHEAEAEINRQKRAEQWRQLVVKEEREERERKKKIEKLQKLIDKEMKRAHHRHHADVNPTYSSTHIQNSHTEFSKLPLCSTATNKPSDSKVVSDALINEQEASLTFEQPKIMSAVAPTEQQLESCYDMEDQLLPDRKDDSSLKDADSTNNATEQTAPSSVTTDVGIAPHDETSTTVDIVKQATAVEQDADSALTEDKEVKTEYKPTDTESLAEDRTYAEHLHTLSPDAEVYTNEQEWSITEPPVQDTIAALMTEPAAHKSSATPTVLQITTEPQIQPPDVTVTTQPEANEESRATPTVQIITDSDTRSESHDTQFLYHLNNTDDIYRTPESMSRVFTCRHSEYSCEILYLLLYS